MLNIKKQRNLLIILAEKFTSDEIDAIYIPLPPALHFRWAKMALENGKHVLVEKPSTISAEQTKQLIKIAKDKGLAVHENYMFVFHKQLEEIDAVVKSGQIGDVRLYRICFGFPKRAANDFRYNKALGGGALIDAGGYTIKLASKILGNKVHISYAVMNYVEGIEVDLFGSGAMTNDDNVTVQFSYGMDNNYKCELEVWGSEGCLYTGRILTAPAGFIPQLTIRKGNDEKTISLSEDDTFYKSILKFEQAVFDQKVRGECYEEIVYQAELVDEFKKMAGV